MIEKEQIMEKLLAACPSYKKRYDQYLEEHYEMGEERLIYVDISDLVRHVIECYRNHKTDEFDELFDVIEQFYAEGDSYVTEFATIGILESLQNQLLDQHIPYREFERLLGPESGRRWNDLIDFWKGKPSAD